MSFHCRQFECCSICGTGQYKCLTALCHISRSKTMENIYECFIFSKFSCAVQRVNAINTRAVKIIITIIEHELARRSSVRGPVHR